MGIDEERQRSQNLEGSIMSDNKAEGRNLSIGSVCQPLLPFRKSN